MPKDQAEKLLKSIPGWTLVDNTLVKEYKFKEYLQGLEFAYSLGKTAEQEDHHPDILIKWRRVQVFLTTHNIKGLSDNDFIMAAKADEEYKKLQG